MLEKIDPNNAQLQGLVIAPTRELAIQTQEELYRLGRDKKIRVQAVYGGADINRQIRQLKNRPHIVVGTPGRMLDHIKKRYDTLLMFTFPYFVGCRPWCNCF